MPAAGVADGDDDVDARARRRSGRPRGARRRAARAELEHLAEHGDGARAAALADRDQRVEGGRHRRGVGVVGVVDHDQAVGALVQLHPPPRGRRPPRSGRRAQWPRSTPGRDGHRGGRGGVGDLVGAGLR